MALVLERIGIEIVICNFLKTGKIRCVSLSHLGRKYRVWWIVKIPEGGYLAKRLLLVEDEPGLVMTLSDLLTAEGYQVETAGDGQTALNLIGQDMFSLIVWT